MLPPSLALGLLRIRSKLLVANHSTGHVRLGSGIGISSGNSTVDIAIWLLVLWLCRYSEVILVLLLTTVN